MHASKPSIPGRLPLVRTLSEETVAALADSPLRVGLAGRPGPVLLGTLEALDTPDAVTIATKLAAKQGPLQIPKLKRLSPKTLSALLDKVDIEIPRVTDLELINEPDGSPTDDFVLPPGYEDRKTSPPARGR